MRTQSTLQWVVAILFTAANAMAQQAGTPVFKGSLNLVLVPVVVTDAEGRPVNDLKADAFQLFDKGKRQSITTFSMQAAPSMVAPHDAAGEADSKTTAPQPAESFTAFLFDDIHLKADDLVRVRDATDRFLQSNRQSAARFAVFTTSGQTTLDFTGNREKLHEALSRIQARPVTSGQTSCPALSEYEADLIVNKQNDPALQAAMHQVIFCLNLGSDNQALAKRKTLEAAHLKLEASETGAKLSFSAFEVVTRRLSKQSGQRAIALISPGFLVTDSIRVEQDQAVDRAVKAAVAISVLDARGLYSPSVGGDISKPSYDVATAKAATQYARESAASSAGVLAEVAESTGGELAHNSNDLDAGLTAIAGVGRSRYILGFAPQNLKLDGGFHPLKVRLTSKGNMTVQARNGYYALPAPEFGEMAGRDLEDALFFRTEIHEFPVDVQTHVKINEGKTEELSVSLHVGIEPLHFSTAAGLIQDDLTVVVGLFDSNRKYVTAKKQVVQLRLTEANVDRARAAGLNLTESFDTGPGAYTIRVVAQDLEGGLLSATTAAAVAP